MTHVYLSGGILGLTDEEIHGWRDYIKSWFALDNIDFSDPSRRKPSIEKLIVEIDKAEIIKCDLMICKAFPASWGTAMEIIFAWTNNIPVISWIPSNENISPWITYHSIVTANTLDSLILQIKEFLDLLK